MIQDNHLRLPRGAIAPADDIVTQLEASQFTFYLTGSYYFGCATPDSDVDFMVQDSPETEEWLVSVGFQRMGEKNESKYTNDGPTHAVYENGNVQVQLIYNVQAKRAARTALAQWFADEHKAADKNTRAAVWKVLNDAFAQVAVIFVVGDITEF